MNRLIWILGCLLAVSFVTASATAKTLVPKKDAAKTEIVKPVEETKKVELAEEPSEEPAETTVQEGDTAEDAEKPLKPRLILKVPSLKRLLAEAKRSNMGLFGEHIVRTLTVGMGESSEGVDADQLAMLLEDVSSWPDTSFSLVNFAPRADGTLRWAARFDWPVEQTVQRLERLLDLEAADTILEGISIRETERGLQIMLPDLPLGYVVDSGDGGTMLRSTEDVAAERPRPKGDPEKAPVIYCQLNIAGTKKDSSSVLGDVPWIGGIAYWSSVDDNGDWNEHFSVTWNSLVGMGVKMLLGKAKQPFYVPESALKAAVFAVKDGGGLLDVFSGLEPGTIGTFAGDDLCVCMLPGSGFFPVPDVVVQSRTRLPNTLLDKVRKATEEINKKHEEKDQPPLWNEIDVDGQPVFWADQMAVQGQMMPFTLRTVVTCVHGKDPKSRERDFVFLGLTSTDPEDLVRRWKKQWPAPSHRPIPTEENVDWQGWVHWKGLYEIYGPILAMAFDAMDAPPPLPAMDEALKHLTDSIVTVKIKWEGLSVKHRGPVAFGAIFVPVATAMSFGESGSGDIGHERIARQRLKVLYHHAKLFEKDFGRWPAEVRELDGYVDFASYPYLLNIKKAGRKGFQGFLENVFGESELEEDDEDEEESIFDIDDSIYRIEWFEDGWRLGFTPKTFAHIEDLYIDQDGLIHRVEMQAEENTEDADEPTEPAAKS